MPSSRWPTVLHALFDMSRPEQLLLMAPVYGMGVAAAVADGASVDPWVVALAFLAFLPVAASVHYANEYADYETDQLAERTRFSGGSGALDRTGLPRALPLRAAVVSLAVGVAATAVLFAVGSLTLPAVIVLALVAGFGWQYSVPPLALAWRGLGELDNAALGGVALPVFGYAVVAERVTVEAVVAFLPFGLLVFVNLLAVTWPDREPDAAVGKRTLATRWSTGRLRVVYAFALLAAYGSLVVLWGTAIPPLAGWATVLAGPLFVWGWRAYTRQRSAFPTVAGMVVVAVGQCAGWVAAVW